MSAFTDTLVSNKKSELLTDEYDYWKDLIGEWEFEYISGHGTEKERHVEGEWIFERVLEGIGIQDMFICPSRKTREENPQPDAEYGVTLRMFNPSTKMWDMVYTCCGQMERFVGTKEDGKIVLTNLDNPSRKWAFVEISKTKFHWQNITVLPNKSWKINSDIYAVKKS
ncbi:hypothetical protein [Clostridium oryzae]|uniref:DUF1579 domain-containing protein n=1 Tax=Clostridium oryzae TaxID=1450648 RepID=A0A1V4IEG2_9CLOT|nr:hypothetical protein [Clostridium oryzae]OPJ58309.1 hypothetical protein CLORY_36720 [Clostridium oryzae]